MRKRNVRHGQAYFSAILALYWAIYGLMVSFGSVFLLDKQFTNAQIGLVLGISYALSAFLQPVLAAVVDRFHLRLQSTLIACYGLLMVLDGLLFFAPMPQTAFSALLIFIISLTCALQPGINTLVQLLTMAGAPVNYSAARGVSSLCYACMTTALGFLFNRISPALIPLFRMAGMAAMIMLLSARAIPECLEKAEKAPNTTPASELLRSGPFLCFLGGVVCLNLSHVVMDNFMLQIMQNVGGGSESLGISVAVAAACEVPALFLYSRFSQRWGHGKLMVFASWMWSIHHGLIMLAPSPVAIYLAQTMQFASFAIYTPAMLLYVAEALPPKEYLKGQAIAGSANTLGCVAATFLGGMLLDLLGVRATLLFAVACTLIGALLTTLAVRNKAARA